MINLFNKKIAPACEYCVHGKKSSEYNMVLCSTKGIVSPYFRCRKFKYNPIRRQPKVDVIHNGLKPEDFTL